MNCNVCTSDDVVEIKKIQSPRIDKKYTLYYCNKCQSYSFDKDEHYISLNELYNQDERTFNNEFVYSKYWANEVKYIKKIANVDRNTKLDILDIGCRTGDFLNHWDKTHNLYGVEINKNNANIAKSRGITVYQDFIEDIEFRKEFDIVTCYAILEHVYNPKEVLKKMVSVLKQNGILVIMIPTIECELRKKLDKKNIHWHMYSPPEHLTFYSRKFLDDYMKSESLQMIKRRYTSGGLRFRYKYKDITRNDFEYLKKCYSFKYKLNALEKIVEKSFSFLENKTFLGSRSYYDHMYSYYKKIAL